MDIMQAIDKVFAPCLGDLRIWRNWFTLLKAMFGISLDRDEKKVFRKVAKRKPGGPFREVFIIAGRRSGKSFITSLVAIFLALFFDYRPYLKAGERGVIQILAVDRAQARVIFNYICGILNSTDILRQYVIKELTERIELKTNVDIEVATCSYKAIRGRTVVACLCDEIAFWDVEGKNPDKEVITAIRPSMGTIPTSKLICLSTPYAKRGVLYDAFERSFGRDDPDTLVIQAESLLLNPTRRVDAPVSRRNPHRPHRADFPQWVPQA